MHACTCVSVGKIIVTGCMVYRFSFFPLRRLGMSDGPLQSVISGLSFDFPHLFFSLVQYFSCYFCSGSILAIFSRKLSSILRLRL